MRIYRIWTNKRDFERIFNERPERCKYEFYFITERRDMFRDIAVDKFYSNELLEASNHTDMALIELEPLVIEKLFSERIYQVHLVDEDKEEQALNEVAWKVSKAIESKYNDDLDLEVLPFQIYEPEYKKEAIDDAWKSGILPYEHEESFL
ncbi:hypothetical protein [Moritella viscosa]|uniref:hypothetical protein n=1 Tax=Moritella viscosa TaxID=80854 RepID=UPI000A63A7C9|nr:hypothetical protein [Moritella viscosa]